MKYICVCTICSIGDKLHHIMIISNTEINFFQAKSHSIKFGLVTFVQEDLIQEAFAQVTIATP